MMNFWTRPSFLHIIKGKINFVNNWKNILIILSMMKTDPKTLLETWTISNEKLSTKYAKDMPLIENMSRNYKTIWVILQSLKPKTPPSLNSHADNYLKNTWKTKCKWEGLTLWWCLVWCLVWCLDKWVWVVILCNKKWWCSNKWWEVETLTWIPWWDKVEECLLWDLMEHRTLNSQHLKMNKMKISMKMKMKINKIMRKNNNRVDLRETNSLREMNIIEILIILILTLIHMEETIWWVIMEEPQDSKILWWWTLKCNIWWCSNNNN